WSIWTCAPSAGASWPLPCCGSLPVRGTPAFGGVVAGCDRRNCRPTPPGFRRLCGTCSGSQRPAGEERARPRPSCSPRADSVLAVSPPSRCPRPFRGSWVPICVTHLVAAFLSHSHAATLGVQLADLHLDNKRLGETLQKEAGTVGKGGGQVERPFVDQFGFDVVTCCGYLPQVNDWQSDWVTFYARQRIQPQMELLEQGSGDREARELWAALQLKIPDLFRDLDIVPALLHGDLWGGNVAEDPSGPVIFDPASFYGHSEYELAIAGFERRHQLYQLFHYLNHWNHFGAGYRGSSLSIMRNLVR
uniref:protein-ribulosamine 3-kinase n=1 Tax=Sus scrofa TaxID=9823 RepID=A0A8D1DQH1_PIG